MTIIHRPIKRFNAAGSQGAAGQSRPITVASSGFVALDRNITASHITASFSVGPVQEVLIPTARIAFPGFEFKVEPPEGEKANEQKIDEALKGLKQSDVVMRRLENIRLAWFDTTGYRHSFYNYSMKTEGQWTLPDPFFHMPADSFSQAPRSLYNNEKYYTDPLLKGYVVDRTDNSEHYYQTQTRTGDPVELDPETVLHLSDEAVGSSILAGVIPSIRQWQYARGKAVMGYLQRAAAPNAVATIDPVYLDLDYAGDKTLGIPTELWSYLSELIKMQSTDTAFLVPPGTNLSYPAINARSPIEIDQYLKREIYNHLVPTSLLDTLGSSISKSSAPALELLNLLANGWREVTAAKFEAFDTKLLADNGFDGFRVFYEWWPILPKDIASESARTATGVQVGYITINEARKQAGLAELDEEGLARLLEEHKALKGAPAPQFAT